MAEDREALSKMADALDRMIIIDGLEELWAAVAYSNDPYRPYDSDDVLDLIRKLENEQ